MIRQEASSPSVAWGGAGLHQDTRPTLNVMFDGPSLEISSKQSKKGVRFVQFLILSINLLLIFTKEVGAVFVCVRIFCVLNLAVV